MIWNWQIIVSFYLFHCCLSFFGRTVISSLCIHDSRSIVLYGFSEMAQQRTQLKEKLWMAANAVCARDVQILWVNKEFVNTSPIPSIPIYPSNLLVPPFIFLSSIFLLLLCPFHSYPSLRHYISFLLLFPIWHLFVSMSSHIVITIYTHLPINPHHLIPPLAKFWSTPTSPFQLSLVWRRVPNPNVICPFPLQMLPGMLRSSKNFAQESSICSLLCLYNHVFQSSKCSL